MWIANKRCWNCSIIVRGRDKLFCYKCKPKKDIKNLKNSI